MDKNTEKQPVSCVIPTFNGLHLVQKNLPAMMAAGNLYGPSVEWIVIDDGSADGTQAWVRKNLPAVRLIENPLNRGFIQSVNTGVQAASAEIVFLFNNDIFISDDFITPVTGHFLDKDVFAVTFNSRFPETGGFREGAKNIRFSLGFFKLKHAQRNQPGILGNKIPSLYAVGGHCALRRSLYLELEGLDSVFEPYYWEDADLGFRAWKKGWKIFYEPGVFVFHGERGTIASLNKSRDIELIKYRNRLIFTWKNLDDSGLFGLHVFFLFIRFLLSWIWLDFKFYDYFFKAFQKIPEVLLSRKKRIKRGETLPDSRILKYFKQP